jgi:hypothetical protein
MLLIYCVSTVLIQTECGGVFFEHTFNFLGTFRPDVFVVQISDLLFLGRGERCGITGGFVGADEYAVGHRGGRARYSKLGKRSISFL